MTEVSLLPIEPLDVGSLLDVIAPDDIRIRGHRIGIEHIVYAFNRGETPEEVIHRYPGLDLRTVYMLIAYYLTHHTLIDTYIAQLEQSSAESRQTWEQSRTPVSHRISAILRERANQEYAP